MNNRSNTLKRRDFLTGAVTALGAGVVAAVPGLAAAQGLGGGSGGVAPTPGLFFWNGSSFIPANQVVPDINADQVQVQIAGYGTSPNLTSVDVQMPGGLFHAFTAQPQGQQVSQFIAAINTPIGLYLAVMAGQNKATLMLQANESPGPKLASGTYIITDPGASVNGFVLTNSTTAPVTYADGQPVQIPYLLLAISE